MSSTKVPELSIVVICYNMSRELPRTLLALSRQYQRGIENLDYEVIVVDNGSTILPQQSEYQSLDLDLRILYCRSGKKSPAEALNMGLSACRGKLIGVVIDGARMSSPGMLCAATAAAKLHARSIIYTEMFALGKLPQWEAHMNGYNQAIEDKLLTSINWPEDGYKLFEISSHYSNGGENFMPSGLGYESNFIFMSRILWDELNGYDEKFEADGGGLLSADLFIRACELPNIQVIMIKGEATFHQYHTLSASSSNPDVRNQLKWFSREYAAITKKPLRVPKNSYWQFQVAPQLVSDHNSDHYDPEQKAALAARYIDLLKRIVLNETALDLEAQIRLSDRLYSKINVKHANTDVVKPNSVQLKQMTEKLKREREVGIWIDSLPKAFTMIGRRRLDSLVNHILTVLNESIPGDFVECGVWRGGAAMVMSGMLTAYDIHDRHVWLADSFEGLPAYDPIMDGNLSDRDFSSKNLNDMGLAVTLADVRANFERYGLLTKYVKFLPGWFSDSLPNSPIQSIAVLRLDGDFYGSTMDALVNLYHRVSLGGFVIIDDYGAVEGCKRAVHDFRDQFDITEPLEKIDWAGIYWRKNKMIKRRASQ